MNEQEKLYHSALSRCAELLGNMPEGDPLVDVPMFLAAKLKQLHAPVPRVGGVTIEELDLPPLPLDLDSTASRVFIQIKAGELAAHMRRWGNAVYKGAIAASLASQSQAVQPSTFGDSAGITPEYKAAQQEANKTARNGLESIAGQSQATRAVPEGLANLTRYMFTFEGMEIDNACGRYYLADDVDSFVERVTAPTAQEVTQQAAPECAMCNDSGIVGFPPDQYEECPDCIAARTATQQAAKAETAEQAEGAQANVLPPFAAPASRVHFDDATIEAAALKHVATEYHNIAHLIPSYRCTEQFARLKAFAEELASGFREGRNAQPDSSDLAPTTSTVSAPIPAVVREAVEAAFEDRAGWRTKIAAAVRALDCDAPSSAEGAQAAPEEVRNQALEDAAKVALKERDEFREQAAKNNGRESDFAFGSVNSSERICNAIRALRTTSGKGEAA